MNFEKPSAWADAFEAFFAYFASFFHRNETRKSAQAYLRGLLADVERKNGWQLAEATGLFDPHPLQRLLNEALWEADAVCQQMRQVVNTQIGYAPGIGVIDESCVVKRGDKSAGVGRQYCGRIGKVENCQVGVYLSYVTPHGAAFLDRQLYLPQDWCSDRERWRAAKIPDDVVFQTKPQIAQAMLKQTWAEDIPMQWVTTDTLYGNSPDFRSAIHLSGRWYVLAVGSHHYVTLSKAESRIKLKELPNTLPKTAWHMMAFNLGEKGLIWHDWAALRVEMPNDEIGEQWLLVKRSVNQSEECEFYLSNAPLETSIADLAVVALARHSIEQLIEEAKGQVGLADYEVRHWHGWYRHMTLCLLAHTWLTLLRHTEQEKKSAAQLVRLEPGGTTLFAQHLFASSTDHEAISPTLVSLAA